LRDIGEGGEEVKKKMNYKTMSLHQTQNRVELSDELNRPYHLSLAKEGKDNRNHRAMPCNTGKSCWCDLATAGDCPEHY
jgi:hypothetical protein